MSDLVSLLFSFQGRIGRTPYWIVSILWGIAFQVAIHTLPPGEESPAIWIALVLLFVSLWPLLAVQVKRWHDRNKSGWWVLINFVPIIGPLWALLELGFLGPFDEGNPY